MTIPKTDSRTPAMPTEAAPPWFRERVAAPFRYAGAAFRAASAVIVSFVMFELIAVAIVAAVVAAATAAITASVGMAILGIASLPASLIYRTA